MKITAKKLKEIIAEEMQKLSEMDDTSSDTRAAMEGSDLIKLLDIIQTENGIQKLMGAISTLPRDKQKKLANMILNPMGADGKTPQYESLANKKRK